MMTGKCAWHAHGRPIRGLGGRALGVVASATLAVLAAPAVAHADGEELTTAYVPAVAKVNKPIDTAQLESVPDAVQNVQKALDKSAMNRNDKLSRSALGG